MKKLLSLMMALAMLLCGVALAEPVDYTGTWVLTGAEAEGVTMGPSTLELMGLTMTMTLSEDGNCVLVTAGVEEKGTWAATETGVAITDATGTVNLLYQDEMLVISEAGALMMLTREGAAPAVAEAAGPVALAGVPAEAFEGQWQLSRMSMMGMEVPVEATGMYMAFVFQGGEGIFGQTNAEGGVDQTAVTYTVNEVEGVGSVLSVQAMNEETNENEAVLDLMMSEAGELFLEEEGVVMYFSPVVEEAAE